MKCKKCGKNDFTKAGFSLGRQNYKCKNCGGKYSVKFRSNERPASLKRQALHLYIEGISLRAISRHLNESYPNVRNWIEKYGEGLAKIRSEDKISVIQIDKLNKYIRKEGEGSKFLVIEVTDNQSKTYLVRDKQKLKKPTKK